VITDLLESSVHGADFLLAKFCGPAII
jgi:hypothetical protein